MTSKALAHKMLYMLIAALLLLLIASPTALASDGEALFDPGEDYQGENLQLIEEMIIEDEFVEQQPVVEQPVIEEQPEIVEIVDEELPLAAEAQLLAIEEQEPPQSAAAEGQLRLAAFGATALLLLAALWVWRQRCRRERAAQRESK
ncbi:MAG: hypothetical protein Q4B96_07680 [Bacillota bacterium]|nr:hypothetical protein [Bacillota bacterium]